MAPAHRRSALRRRHFMGLGFFWLCLAGMSVAHAQPPADPCEYRDERGECLARPPFRESPKPPPQRIVVHSDPPGATVTLGGKVLGQTPLRIAQYIAPGMRALVVSKKHHVVYHESVQIPAHGTRTFIAKLVHHPKVTVELRDDAEQSSAVLSIDGHEKGSLPQREIYVTPGEHEFKVARARHEDFAITMKTEAGKDYTLSPVLKPERGSIAIGGNLRRVPVGLSRSVDCLPDRFTALDESSFSRTQEGVTPLTIPNLPVQKYCVVFWIDGVGVFGKEVTVKSNQSAFVEINFPEDELSYNGKIVIDKWTRRKIRSISKKCRTADKKSEEDRKHLAWKCVQLGWYIKRFEKQKKLAFKSYKAACDLGSPEGCESQGWSIRVNGESTDDWRRLYETACVKGLKSACYRLHLDGDSDRRRDPAYEHRIIKSDPIDDRYIAFGLRLEFGLARDLGISVSPTFRLLGVIPEEGNFFSLSPYINVGEKTLYYSEFNPDFYAPIPSQIFPNVEYATHISYLSFGFTGGHVFWRSAGAASGIVSELGVRIFSEHRLQHIQGPLTLEVGRGYGVGGEGALLFFTRRGGYLVDAGLSIATSAPRGAFLSDQKNILLGTRVYLGAIVGIKFDFLLF